MKKVMAMSVLTAFVLLVSAIPVMAQTNVTFESPEYALGNLDGQSGGGMEWLEFDANKSSVVVTPGYNSNQAGRWGVDDNGGDDMLGLFDNGQASSFSLSAMSFVHDNTAGHFFVSDIDFFGSAVTWQENGNIGYWGGGGYFINDTGVAIMYDQWVPIKMQVDYDNDQITIFYDGLQIAQDTLTGKGAGYADQVDVWLDSSDTSGYMLFDDIVITPEPATSLLLVIGAFAGLLYWRRG